MKKLIQGLIAIAVCFSVCSTAMAKEDLYKVKYSKTYVKCLKEAGSSVPEKDVCITKEMTEIEKLLNDTYASTYAKLNDTAKAQLEASQTAWKQYREESSKNVIVFLGDKLGPQVTAKQLSIRLTAERIAQLRMFSKWF